jgi:hypothetical protein
MPSCEETGLNRDGLSSSRLSQRSHQLEERVRTSGLGWRIVAAGTLILIFGASALTNEVGPGWFAWLLLVVGTMVIIIGRRT